MSLLPFQGRSGMFFDAHWRAVVKCLVQWGKQIDRGTVDKSAQIGLEGACEFLAARQWSPNRAAVVSFDGGRSAFFDNHSHEYLADAELFIVCERLKTQGYFFSCDERPDSDQCGSAQFNAYRYATPGVQQRQVMLYKESGWVFSATGEPLPFERTEAYAIRDKKQRLNAEILRAYGEALSLRFWDAGFYGRDVALLRWGDPAPADDASTLQKIMHVLGRPTYILDRLGLRKPPTCEVDPKNWAP